MFRAVRYGWVSSLPEITAWEEFFFSLPFLILLTYIHRRLIENEIFNEYKNTVAFSTGTLLIWMALSFFASFSRDAITIFGVFIPILNPLDLRQAVFIISLALWLQIFVFYDLDESSFQKWNKRAQFGIGVLLFLWFAQVTIRAI